MNQKTSINSKMACKPKSSVGFCFLQIIIPLSWSIYVSAGRFVEIWAAVCIFGVKVIYIHFLQETYMLFKKKDVSNFFLPN